MAGAAEIHLWSYGNCGVTHLSVPFFAYSVPIFSHLCLSVQSNSNRGRARYGTFAAPAISSRQSCLTISSQVVKRPTKIEIMLCLSAQWLSPSSHASTVFNSADTMIN